MQRWSDFNFWTRPTDAQEEWPETPARLGAAGPEVLVPGRHVLATFEIGVEWLVFSEHDILFEELLEICLVTGEGIIDRVGLGFLSCSGDGIFPQRRAACVFAFAFPEGRCWCLEVAAQARFVRPRLGVYRDGHWRSRLLLCRDKGLR